MVCKFYHANKVGAEATANISGRLLAVAAKGRLKFSDGLKLLLDMKGFILRFRKTRIPYI